MTRCPNRVKFGAALTAIATSQSNNSIGSARINGWHSRRHPPGVYRQDNGRRRAFGVRSAVDTVTCDGGAKSMTDRYDANVTNVNGNPRISPADLRYFHFAR
jgi:hypothetical protein